MACRTLPCRVAISYPRPSPAVRCQRSADVELDVFPQRASFPTVETGHIEQHPRSSVAPDELLERGHQVLVIQGSQLPAYVNDEHLPAIFLVEWMGILASFDSIQIRAWIFFAAAPGADHRRESV